MSAAFMRRILEGYLAVAQLLFPVTICHLVFMGNHVHLIIKVIDPANVSDFIGYFKRESSHAINRLLGRVNKTVWVKGFDSPILLDTATLLHRIAYLYCNPSKADLTDTIDRYPHINSWKAFLSGQTESRICARLPRDEVPRLPRGALNDKKLAQLERIVVDRSQGEYSLTIEPDAWMDCFEESRQANREQLRREVVCRVRELEARYRKCRRGPVVGRQQLLRQNMRKSHLPKKRGNKMICLGASKEIRRTFNSFFKRLAEDARESLRLIRAGMKALPPPSFFAPGGYLSGNLVPFAVPLPLS